MRPPYSRRTVPLDYVVAVNNTTIGWPPYLDLYAMDGPKLLLRREVFSDLSFATLPPGNTLTRTLKVDQISRALSASGAQTVDVKEFYFQYKTVRVGCIIYL